MQDFCCLTFKSPHVGSTRILPLQGNVPSEIGTMSGLQYLNLEANEFEGSLPADVGNLGNLKVSDSCNSVSSFPLVTPIHFVKPFRSSEHNDFEELLW